MLSKQYHLDLIAAAKSHKNFDKVNALEISTRHGVELSYVQDDIICKRAHIEEVKKAKESLKVLKGELDKLG